MQGALRHDRPMGQAMSKPAAATLASLLATAALLHQGASAQQIKSAKLDPEVFPPTQLFREVQLETIACGRDNSPAPCDKARAMADPLMDHPGLPAACKDSAWTIREKAVVAPKNSYERRELLNKTATDLVTLCKPATKPIGNGGSASTKDEGKKSGGLGGFLKGLGFGGNNDKP